MMLYPKCSPLTTSGRNDVVHRALVRKGKGRIVSTIARAHTARAIRERSVSPELLDDMTGDLMKVALRI